MKNNVVRSLSAGLLQTLIAGIALSPCVVADWNDNAGGISVNDPQDIVISLKSDPRRDPEAACLAVTFARSLLRNPNANINITLFVTLDGVKLASDNHISKGRLKKYECTTPFDPPHVTLKENLIAYLSETDPDDDYEYDNNPNLVVCPICWKERYGDEIPDYGVLPGGDSAPKEAIGKMIFNAEKILDF